MSNLGDLWLAHDPLAFCMSTNTFNNPAFEAILEGASSSSSSSSIRRVSNPSMGEQEEQDEEQVVRGRVKKEDRGELGKLKTIRKELAQTLNSFCDNIGFSLKSKLFVLELSLRRKLGRFKRFLQVRGGSHRVSVFKDSFSSGSSSSNNNNNYNVSNHFCGSSNYQPDQWLYWLEQEPHSKESFSQQKERILSRLEQVKRVSKLRRLEEHEGAPVLFNMEHNGARWSSVARHWSASGSCEQQASSDNKQVKPQSASNKVLHGSRPPPRKRKPSRTSKWNKHSRRASKYNYHTSELAEHVPAEPVQKLCIICYTNQPNIVTLPCKHHEICSDCFVELIYGAVKHSRFPLKCVLCRQKVERIRCSRRWLLSVIEKSRLLA